MDLPQGHWMHAALAKEKARLAKKKTAPTGPKPMPGNAVSAPAIVAGAAPAAAPPMQTKMIPGGGNGAPC